MYFAHTQATDELLGMDNLGAPIFSPCMMEMLSSVQGMSAKCLDDPTSLSKVSLHSCIQWCPYHFGATHVSSAPCWCTLRSPAF